MKREERIDQDIDRIEDPDKRTLVRYLHKAIVVIAIAYSAVISKVLYDKNVRIDRMELKMERMELKMETKTKEMENAKDSIAEVRRTEKVQFYLDSYLREDSIKKVLKKAGL